MIAKISEKTIQVLEEIFNYIHLVSCFLAMAPVIMFLTLWIWIWFIPFEMIGFFWIWFGIISASIYAFWGLSGWIWGKLYTLDLENMKNHQK